MAVYRFRVTFDDNEEVYREVEIRSTQTYQDLHMAILESIGFDHQHNASFFISDDMWRKGEEIVLRAEEAPAGKNRRDEVIEKRLMSKCKMAALIDDPHQKFVYVYDYKAGWTFLVELVKILDDANKAYPICIKTVGEAPKQYKKVAEVAVVDDEDDFEEEEEHHADDAAYVSASSDEDIAELEGEEGEEETHEEESEEEQEEGEDEYGFSEFENGSFDGGDDD